MTFVSLIRQDARADATAGGNDAAGRKNLLLLIQLRWIAVGGQVATMLVVGLGIGIALPVGPMATVLVALVGLNVVSLVRLSRPTAVANPELFTALLLDVAALTLQFYLTGGATNPFTSLYLLQVTLGAVLLDARSTWITVTLTGLCFAGLTIGYCPLDLSAVPERSLFGLHIAGMLICFLLDAALLVVFVTRINGNLRERDARLAALRQQNIEEEHIVRMGLLASGAAHELGTPLATLSVILGDWRRMPALSGDPELMGEIEAMEGEVRRCKSILTGIIVSAGGTRSESAAITTLHAFLDELVEDWRAARPTATLEFVDSLEEDVTIVSDTALKQVITNLLDNAQEASARSIVLDVAREDDTLRLVVSDDGSGFPAELLANVGKPYQSSKDHPGSGLGLFLVVNVVRKLGGHVTVANRPGRRGAVVTLSLPLSVLSVRAEA